MGAVGLGDFIIFGQNYLSTELFEGCLGCLEFQATFTTLHSYEISAFFDQRQTKLTENI